MVRKWRLSAGTAARLGLKPAKSDVFPTTAYIMLGEKCRRSCRFCAQARLAVSRADMLSRVVWPAFAADAVMAALTERPEHFQRVCLQTVDTPAVRSMVEEALPRLNTVGLPVCVTTATGTEQEVAELLAAGADKVCLALDGATPAAYAAAREGTWQERWNLLQVCALRFPGRLATHLIAGLGETEEEMVQAMAACLQMGITVGLFAFTPVPGTAWSRRQPPALDSYRRLQIAYYLLRQGAAVTDFVFQAGRLVSCRLAEQELIGLLRDGAAFRTAGCPGCNRPYYNERPGSVPYNYPRPLTAAETAAAIAASGLCRGDECEMAHH